MDSTDNGRAQLESIIARLSSAGVQFEQGLSKAEIVRAEEKYEVCFPPDLHEFLQIALPLSKPKSGWFPNWRRAVAGHEESDQAVIASLERPAEGICFDVEHNGFWIEEDWGQRPAELDQAKIVAKRKVEEAPRLVPIFSHRYIPSEPNTRGNPVFSVCQTDIIHYGADLVSYFEAEFLGAAVRQDFAAMRNVRFWSRLVS